MDKSAYELAQEATTEITMADLMQATVDEGASDLHIRVGGPPYLRCSGALEPLDVPPFTEADVAKLALEISNEEQIAEVEKNGGADFGLYFSEAARFRVSVFKERHNYGLVLRQIPSTILTLEQLGLPEAVHELLYKPRGLILVTGPTGSGKSTTLASMIDIINQDRDCHIITIEDPIEFYHYSKKSIVTQREVGVDVPSFAEAIRRALRQDPDVILVGEMRDLETIGAAITAAETGHLVFGTLHTTGAASTVDRIIDSFPTNQQEQVRTQLSMSLVAVISQVSKPAPSSAWSPSTPPSSTSTWPAESPTKTLSPRRKTPRQPSRNSAKCKGNKRWPTLPSSSHPSSNSSATTASSTMPKHRSSSASTSKAANPTNS